MADRASYMFKKASMEGHLEKHSTGINRFLGKTQVWCELYDSSFYVFKENKGTSDPQRYDLSQFQAVRRVSSDKSGTQFEIVFKNRPHIYSANSTDECNKWIKNMQQAMTLKDLQVIPESTNNDLFPIGDYETIGTVESGHPFTVRQSTASDTGYADIEYFQKMAHKSEQPLSNIPDVRADQASSEISISDAKAFEEDTPEDENAVAQENEYELNPEMNCSYAQIKKNIKEELAKSEDDYPEHEEPFVLRHSNIPGTETLPVDNFDIYEFDERVVVTEDVYINAASLSEDNTIPALPYSLTADDMAPLEILRKFLTNNSQVCRRSYVDLNPSKDPVADMKAFLQGLCSSL